MLGWPVASLWPNVRSHWSTRARAVKIARTEAHFAAKAAKVAVEGDGPIYLIIKASPRQRKQGGGRPPDLDNLVAALKPSFDGLADALGVDDVRFRPQTPTLVPASRNGWVSIGIAQQHAWVTVTLPDGDTRLVPADILEKHK